ncbi:hypothetical protein KSP40_PGU009967 [Platanthera guangdongensis]|uniref:Uncharacterized protein n=1 Tax=Platanthera guangdongensis TaxID=2320717 RepID=A0ABR2M847_9ASPA
MGSPEQAARGKGGADPDPLEFPEELQGMNEFRSAPLTATVTDDADAAEIPKFPSSEFILPETKPLEKPSRRKKSSEKPAGASPAANSPKRDPSKHSRRRRSSASSSGGDSADGSRRGRRELRERNGEGPLPGEHDPPGIPKQSRRRRTKGSSSNSAGGESSRPRSRTPGNPDQGILEEPGELLKPVGRPEEVAA